MEITYTNKVIKITGDEILDRQERWGRFEHSRLTLWDNLTQEHYEGGHDLCDVDDCEECIARFATESVEEECDRKTLEEILGDVSMREHWALLKMLREKIKSMNLTIEMEV